MNSKIFNKNNLEMAEAVMGEWGGCEMQVNASKATDCRYAIIEVVSCHNYFDLQNRMSEIA